MEEANHLSHNAQMQMLRYQLNPHFLFNALNSIRALIEENEVNAKEMISELSEFLRYSLIGDTIEETEWWACFLTPEQERRQSKVFHQIMEDALKERSKFPQAKTQTVKRKTIKVGRNDPCPCGSGKKYKKCCLNKRSTEKSSYGRST